MAIDFYQNKVREFLTGNKIISSSFTTSKKIYSRIFINIELEDKSVSSLSKEEKIN